MEGSYRKPKIIAVCGKGGVGKTCLSAMIARILTKDTTKKLLVIDADPAIGLSASLGLSVKKTVNDIRKDIINRIENGAAANKDEILSSIDYEFLNAMREHKNLAFLAIGRPEDEGCYCQLNSFLKSIIKDLACGFDYILIDGEAGIEQVNRRVMDMVTHLLLVSDASQKGINVAETIEKVARDLILSQKTGLIINRLMNEGDLKKIQQKTRLPLLGWINEEEIIRDYDIEGRSFFELPNCDALESVKKIVDKF